ncbi:hypothetical protein OAJ57_05655, partial [Alphaproteobacteria bacterium]|nr:hypothetical protein [Alphaproteobacteria bacterium]
LLNVAEDLIGPNLMCRGASFFANKPHEPQYVSWHIGVIFYGYKPKETVATWFFVNEPTPEAGRVRPIPDSHKSRATHEFKPGLKILIPAGQTVRGVMKLKPWVQCCEPGKWFPTMNAWCMDPNPRGPTIHVLVCRSIIARPTCRKLTTAARR